MSPEAYMAPVAAEQPRLPIWVIYDHPTDFPEYYVARKWLTLPTPEPTTAYVSSMHVAPLREALAAAGFTKLPRYAEDDPVILESWI